MCFRTVPVACPNSRFPAHYRLYVPDLIPLSTTPQHSTLSTQHATTHHLTLTTYYHLTTHQLPPTTFTTGHTLSLVHSTFTSKLRTLQASFYTAPPSYSSPSASSAPPPNTRLILRLAVPTMASEGCPMAAAAAACHAFPPHAFRLHAFRPHEGATRRALPCSKRRPASALPALDALALLLGCSVSPSLSIVHWCVGRTPDAACTCSLVTLTCELRPGPLE